MKIFITGATGYIGKFVVKALVQAGHEVTGLVRSPAKGEEIQALGATPHVGDLQDPASYQAAAAGHEALIHTAFDYAANGVARDRLAVETLLAAASSGAGPRVVIYTSGTWVLGETGDEPAYEDAPTDHPAPLVAWRPAHERLVLEGADDRIATAVLRPGMVYGGQGGLVSHYFESAETEGAATYVGEGRNRVSLVHGEDLARLYRLVAEGRGRGIFHGVDDHPVRLVDIARAASQAAGAGGATRSVPLEEARQKLGPVADALCLDQVVGARRSRELGWSPAWPAFPESARRAYREWKGR